jgi:hypothetical protein
MPAAEEIAALKAEIRLMSEFNATSSRDIVLHFQALKSARSPSILMDAPGLFYPDIPLYVVSKSGTARGHATLHNSIAPLLPENKRNAYGFVLYPESYIRSCVDKLLRKTVRRVSLEMRLSMENVFNKKYHHKKQLTDSEIMSRLIILMQKDLGIKG